jgi:hypothetical protein
MQDREKALKRAFAEIFKSDAAIVTLVNYIFRLCGD